MRATAILNLKAWLSKIHPPLPRSTRESQQLLSVLTSSFQRELDEAHPPIERRGVPPSHVPTSRTTLRTPSYPQETGKFSRRPVTDSETSAAPEHETSADVAASLSSAIRQGANDLETLVNFLNAQYAAAQSNMVQQGHFNLVEGTVPTWFHRASVDTRTSVLRNGPILRVMKKILPPGKFRSLMWDEMKRLVTESSGVVTYEEAEAISICASFVVTGTSRVAMNGSASRFEEILDVFRERAYTVQSPDKTIGSPTMAFHPLAEPASRLAQFIIAHPDTHGLDAEHFDALLSIHNLWTNSLLLRVEFVQAFHPRRQDTSAVVRALRNPKFRVAYSSRLKDSGTTLRKISPTAPLAHVCQILHNQQCHRDAEFIESFLEAHTNGEDVSKLVPRPRDAMQTGWHYDLQTT